MKSTSGAYLEHLNVKNFKSFKEIDIKLKQFNVLIGANASGKSNFVQFFNFLKDIREQGLDNAISLQGGIEYLRNFKLGSEQNLMIELKVALPHEVPVRMPFGRSRHRVSYKGATWKFELRLGKISGFQIIQDVWKIDVVTYDRDDFKRTNAKVKGYLEIISKDGKIHQNIHMLDKSFSADFASNRYLYRGPITSKKSLLEHPFALNYMFPKIIAFFDSIMIYDFDPKLAKRATPLTGKVELNYDGSNLAIIVKDVISNNDAKRKFSNLITDLLPFVNSIKTKNIADKSILFTLKENYFKKHSLPSSLMSDGTINITALIIALYFQHNSLTIVEEPERNIHPSLMSKVIEMMMDASLQRQIMITTHNPEIVRYAGLNNLFTVRRNLEGYSEIMCSSTQAEIKTFLEDEMDIEELYVQNILGV